MLFWDWLQAENSRDLEGLSDALAGRFCELMARGHSVADLLSHYAEEFGHLPAARLRELSREYRGWKTWGRRKAGMESARQQAGLPPLPTEVFVSCATPDQLDAAFRTARLCHGLELDHGVRLQLLQAGVLLWNACVGVARKYGHVRCTAKDLTGAGAERYEAYVQTSEGLDGVAPHRWLAMRRGAREGVLELEVELPTEHLLEQEALYHQALTVGSDGERSSESLLDELVLGDLRPWLLTMLDGEAEEQAIRAACVNLTGLLRSPAVQVRRIGSIYLSRAKSPAGIVVADREGELVAQRVLKPEGKWLDKACELFAEHNAGLITLPTSAVDNDLLVGAEAALNGAELQVQRVRPAAMAQARQPLTDPPARLSVSVASALVLARRALDPVKAWSSVDPVGIGVAEYQHDLNEERLRAALIETSEIFRLERRRPKQTAAAAPPPVTARLNPLVRSLADLRPGMQVHGVVSNISHFGAFVGIGLPQEGLVHISELSDEFVSNPNEVVSIGQQVTAQVLSVDLARGRISLSLKGQSARPRPDSGPSRPTAKSGQQAQKPRSGSRAQALANLERLFKK